MSYNFTLPYVHVLQSNGLSYPVTVWIDKDKGRMRMDTYDGLDSVLYTEKTEYVTTPMMDEVVCIAYDPDQVICSLPDAAQGLLQQQALPDMTEWKLAGSHMRADGRCADVWAKTEKDGGKVNQYRFEIARDDGAPLHLHMHGYDLFSGAHFDEYTADFWEYQAGLQDDSALEPTEMCKKHSMDPPLRGSGANSLALQMSMLLPWAMRGDSAFQEFAKSHARQHSSLQEYTWRRSVFHRNRLFIEQFNEQQLAASGGGGGGGGEPLLLGLNHYADWTEDEYHQLLGFRRAHAAAVPRRQPGSYWRSLDQMPARLPSTVDWRGTGADGLVTDQATCGSCWAFSAAAAMESAWWMATGEVLKLSEQQLMDCSWPYFNGACQGGEPFAAIQYVADHGGAVLEADYQYMGEDGFCRVMANSSRKDLDQDLPRAAFFQGYETIPDRSDVALQKAVLYHGPVSISINASPTTFRFYSSGVLDDPTCTGGRDELDHAVLAIGYGTTADGVDYWIVKNSWSQHWGDQGYVLVKRGENDCGVTTEPILPVVAESSRMAEQAALVEA